MRETKQMLAKMTGQENKTGEQEILKVRIHVLRKKKEY